MNTPVLLDVQDLTVTRFSDAGKVVPANHLSFQLHQGQALGIVGESGSGKSTTAYAIMGLLERSADVSGSISYKGTDLLSLSEKEMEKIRGKEIGMIFQSPTLSLDPSFRIGQILREVLLIRQKISRKEADRIVMEQLDRVGFEDPAAVMRKYSFELSGGMCQRVMIAMVLLLSPEIIIADEPTTALDVTIQEGIIRLLKKILKEDQRTLFFITHNFGLVAELCDSVLVMYGGHIVESGSTEDIFREPLHPYTKGLLQAIPSPEYEGKHRLTSIEGTPIDLKDMPSGCPFHPRCSQCQEKCLHSCPPSIVMPNGQSVACWLYE